MKYFVSYTTIDKEITKSFLEYFSKLLEGSGKVYIDLLNNDSVNKQQRVLKEIDNCDEVIIIETENVYKSKWVQLEIARAKMIQKPIRKICFNDISNFCARSEAS